ncbi:YhfC family glutamic-type intramembrane protease [Thermanaerothrix sp.]|uniref:YhfC family glutamic-type intramembrane protease n=1 Tax=Thermanaerothrix sp. TaxID=2972675 RepID=UPI003C7DE1D5
MKHGLYLLLAGTVLGLLASCTVKRSNVPAQERWASVEGGQLRSTQAGEAFYFTIPIDEGMREEGVSLKIRASGEVRNGFLRFELRDPAEQTVWNSGRIGAGDFSLHTAYDLSSARTGRYHLGIVYSDDVSATYNLAWHTLRLDMGILFPGLGMVLVALAFLIFAARRWRLDWRYLGLGAFFWVFAVALKFAVAIPGNAVVFQALGVSDDKVFSPANLVAYFYIGGLTGVFEAGLVYLILRRSRWGRATWEQALMFGIGFGVVEALLLGFSGLTTALIALLAPDALPIPTLGALAQNASLSMGLAPVVERLAVILAHIFATGLIFFAIARGETKWAWLAVLYKTLLDAPGGLASFWGVSTAGKLWTIEAVIAVVGLFGLWGTLQLARHYPLFSPSNGRGF